MGDITVIGSINMDTTKYVKSLPSSASTRIDIDESKNTKYSPGGKGSNQAVSLRRQIPDKDVNVNFIGIIGKDEEGYNVAQSLKNNGVKLNISFSEQSLDNEQHINTPTDGRVVFVCTKGEDKGKNKITGGSGCIKCLTPEIIEKYLSDIENSDTVMIQLKMPEESIEYIINYCDKNGKTILVDPAPVDKIPMLIEKNLIDKVDFFTPNEEEAFYMKRFKEGYTKEQISEIIENKNISRNEIISEIKELVSSQQNIIATVGDKGVIYSKEDSYGTKKVVQKDRFSIGECVDTTGAGDTFNGAFVAAIHRGENNEKAIEYAQLSSALKIQHSGAQNGMPTLDEVNQKMKEIEKEEISRL